LPTVDTPLFGHPSLIVQYYVVATVLAISWEGSRPSVYVIPTDEELLIARDTVRLY
jgi:acetate kinase